MGQICFVLRGKRGGGVHAKRRPIPLVAWGVTCARGRSAIMPAKAEVAVALRSGFWWLMHFMVGTKTRKRYGSSSSCICSTNCADTATAPSFACAKLPCVNSGSNILQSKTITALMLSLPYTIYTQSWLLHVEDCKEFSTAMRKS